MTKLEKALRQMNLSKYDVERYLRDGNTCLTDLESFIDNWEGCGMDWEDDLGMTKEEFIQKWNDAQYDERNFIPDCDLVILDGEKYLIEYCL